MLYRAFALTKNSGSKLQAYCKVKLPASAARPAKVSMCHDRRRVR